MSTARNFKDAARTIARYRAAMGVAPRTFLRVMAEEIMTDVKASRPGRGVPRDEGVLAASGRVSGPAPTGRAVVRLTFGSSAAPYALRQHEELTYRHTVGEARYLVRGVERWQPNGSAAPQALAEQAAAIAARMQPKVNKGGGLKKPRRTRRRRAA